MDVFVRLLVTEALLSLLHELLEQIYFYLVVLNCSCYQCNNLSNQIQIHNQHIPKATERQYQLCGLLRIHAINVELILVCLFSPLRFNDFLYFVRGSGATTVS